MRQVVSDALGDFSAIYDEDVEEVVRTKLDDLVRRAEACGH